MGLRRTEPSYVDGALGRSPVHPIKRNGSAHVPAGTDPLASCLLAELLRRSACGPIEEFAGFQHGVHDNGELPGHGDSGALEADALTELKAPVSQGALCGAAGQDDGRRFVQKISNLVITASGDMAIIVYFA